MLCPSTVLSLWTNGEDISAVDEREKEVMLWFRGSGDREGGGGRYGSCIQQHRTHKRMRHLMDELWIYVF